MIANHQSFIDLIHLLEEESEIYGELSEVLQAEREALLAMNASLVGEITSRKETLGLRIKTLDESRSILSGRLGKSLGLSPQSMTVSSLLSYAPPNLARKLDAARNILKDRAQMCKTINDYNATAANKGLDLISGAIGFVLAEADPAGKIYKKQGGYARTGTRRAPAMISQKV